MVLTQLDACLKTATMSPHMHTAILNLAVKHNIAGMSGADAGKYTAQLAYDVMGTLAVLRAYKCASVLAKASWLFAPDEPAAKFAKVMPDGIADCCIIGLQEIVACHVSEIAASIGAASALHSTPLGVPDMCILFRGLTVDADYTELARTMLDELLTSTVGIESSGAARALIARAQVLVLVPDTGVMVHRIAVVNLHVPSSFELHRPLMVALALLADKCMIDGVRMVTTADANFRSHDAVEAARSALQMTPVAAGSNRLTLIGTPRVLHKQRSTLQTQVQPKKLKKQVVVNDCILHNIPGDVKTGMQPDDGNMLPTHAHPTDHPTLVVTWDKFKFSVLTNNHLSGLGTNYFEFMQNQFGGGVSRQEYDLAHEGLGNTYARVTFHDVLGVLDATAHPAGKQQLEVFLTDRDISTADSVLDCLLLLDLSLDKVCQPGRFNPVRLGTLPMP